ncbi:hypothetical protein [Halorientalis pallida]|uniref:Thrombospondin type 3 repeat-containing protein n=1 Tax=Halorientalis pallida TaxID=2479928 RepID=A0A498KXE1_9EURY|nr:hypothetical protein [Halorientalis pallida]RXK50290.1 hypothetical protein EAF64_06940 [Halorientalis pallida]
MRPDDGRAWPQIGAVVVLLCVAALGGLALWNAGPAGTAVAAQSNDTDWNATNGSDAVAPGCPPADALRREVFDGLETRSIEEVRSTIPSDAVRCLPEDVLAALDLGNETDDSASGSDGNETDGTDSTADTNSTEATNSTDDTSSTEGSDSTDGCPPADVIRIEVNAALAENSKAEVRAEFTDEEIDCLPADVRDDLNIGDDDGSGTGTDDTANDTAGDGTSGVDCPSDEEIRESVETALAGSSPATVRAQIPEEYEDCLPADVKATLNGGTNASAVSTGTDTAAGSGGNTGTGTGTDGGVDCPPAETIREDVNETLEKMSAAQFRTMVPAEYVECFPPDVRERLGLTSEGGASGGSGSQSAGTGEAATDSSTPLGGPDSTLFDSDGDGVVNARDHAPNDSSVQFADSDGDGVPDPYDYAPRDPSVQEEGDAEAAADPAGEDGAGGDGIPVAAGSALLLVLAAGTGAVVYRHYGGPGSDDDGLPQPAGTGSVTADEPSSEARDVFGESAFDPDDSAGTGAAFTFDEHEGDAGDAGGFVFDNDSDEDVITLDSDGSVPDAETETGFVFEGGPNPELDGAGETADD